MVRARAPISRRPSPLLRVTLAAWRTHLPVPLPGKCSVGSRALRIRSARSVLRYELPVDVVPQLRYIDWIMDTVSVRGSPGSGWFTTLGFAKLASTWFAGLLGLYGVYALIAFYRLPSRFPSADRAIMVLGPTTIALALLVSAATFAASAMRFHLLTTRDVERRRIYWMLLGLFGLGAYLLVAIGAPLVRSMLPGGSDLPTETLLPYANRLSSLRLVVPIPFGVFAVLSRGCGCFAWANDLKIGPETC